jgi:MFS family permease
VGGIGATGATIGLLAGGLLTRYAGWEYIFYLNIPIGVAALLIAPRVVPESRLESARRRFDPLGAFTVTGSLLLLVYALSKAPEVGWGAASAVTLLGVSAVLLIAFLVIETRVEAPLMPLRIFRSRTLAGANAVGLMLGGSFFALSSSAPCTCSRYSATRPCRRVSPGLPRHSPSSRSLASRRCWSRASRPGP